jgi:hypothetical protein
LQSGAFAAIDADIPLQGGWTVRLAFYGQLGFCFLLLWNRLASFGSGINDDYNATQNAIPCGFKINYMRLYRQVRKNDISLLFFGIQALFVAALAIGLVGLENWGCIGIITATGALEHGSPYAKVTIGICAVLWGIAVAWEVMVLGKILLLFKTTGPQPAAA